LLVPQHLEFVLLLLRVERLAPDNFDDVLRVLADNDYLRLGLSVLRRLELAEAF